MTPDIARALAAGAAHLGVLLDAAATERIDRYLAVLAAWGRHTRLTGERDEEAIVRKHVVDSLAAAPLLPPAGLVVDVGSGAGFPGLILACTRPDLDVVLVEARRRRVSFLREAAREAGLPLVSALEVRAEELASRPGIASAAALAVARALRLDVFLALARPLVAPGGAIVAMQTPAAIPLARAAGDAHGLRLKDVHPYTLPAGERRALIVYDVFPGKPVS
jgi:16S rRNA (guanine527-N7)-methyltransferase